MAGINYINETTAPVQEPATNPGTNDTTPGGAQTQEDAGFFDDEDEDAIDPDMAEFIESMQDPEDDPDEEAAEEERRAARNSASNNATARSLETELNGALSRITIPENLIPEDFDASDPRQLRDVLGGVAQHAARQALALSLRPMNAAMQNMRTVMDEAIKRQIDSSGSQRDEWSRLVGAAPVLADTKNHAIFKPMIAEMKSRKVPLDKQAKYINTMARNMGLDRKKTSANSDGKGTTLVGRSALDDLFE